MTANDTTETQTSQSPLDALAGEVDASLHPLLQTVVDNIKLIVSVIVVLIVAVGGYALFDAMQASKITEGREKLAAAAATEDPAERVKALEALKAEAPGALGNAVLLELAGALSEAGEHERSAEIWKTLSAEDTAGLGPAAVLGRCAELSRAGKHAEAAAALAALRASAPKGYNVLILQRLAYESELSGDVSAALEAWEALLEVNQAQDNAFIQSKIASLRSKLEPAS
ncbi:hypothetical protein [Desulfocurvus sp. DL9XJH121]